MKKKHILIRISVYFYKTLKVLTILLLFGVFVYTLIQEMPNYQQTKKSQEQYNVALIKINSKISNDEVDKLIEKINKAESDNKIKAILFEINSRGGYVSPSSELESLIRNCSKFTAAYIRACGASGAYLAASATDFIFSTKNSDIGSIAVDASYLDISQKNSNEGITFNNLTSGKYKNMWDENLPLSSEENKLIKKELMIHHHYFVEQVALNRNLSYDFISKIADGRCFLGEEALELSLIDKLVENINDIKKELELQVNDKVILKNF
jgi:signal peptide peptidase SppA